MTSSNFSDFSDFHFDFDNESETSTSQDRRDRRWIKPQMSPIEMQQEEERSLFAHELVAIVEPRPQCGNLLGGIEETLEGQY